jgi:hypothetical protein
MAHNLIVNYGLYRDMEVFVRASRVPCPRTAAVLWVWVVPAQWPLCFVAAAGPD